MRTLNALSAAGGTDAGLQREVNEDRYHVDEARGLFIVIDGIGGQAAGGKAADVALSMIRERLERETGPIPDRVREAIAIANNEIYRLSSARPEWDGMACVLTALVLKDGTATIGHVGDTRLYKLRARPHREDHQGSFSHWRTGGCESAFRIRGDAAPATKRGVSRRRVRASLTRRCGVRRCAGDSVRARCSAAACAATA